MSSIEPPSCKRLEKNHSFMKYKGASESSDDYRSNSTCVPGFGAKNSSERKYFSVACAGKLLLTANC